MDAAPPSPKAAAFIDPGAASGLAVVEWLAGRPAARWVGWVTRTNDAAEWATRSRDAVQRCAAYLAMPAVAWLEIPGDAPAWAARRRGARHAGERDIRALAMRAGALAALWRAASSVPLREVQQREWALVWGSCILPGKRSGGRHRLTEAGALVPGAAALLATVPAGCRVDVAEAILGAAAALIEARR